MACKKKKHHPYRASVLMAYHKDMVSNLHAWKARTWTFLRGLGAETSSLLFRKESLNRIA